MAVTVTVTVTPPISISICLSVCLARAKNLLHRVAPRRAALYEIPIRAIFRHLDVLRASLRRLLRLDLFDLIQIVVINSDFTQGVCVCV